VVTDDVQITVRSLRLDHYIYMLTREGWRIARRGVDRVGFLDAREPGSRAGREVDVGAGWITLDGSLSPPPDPSPALRPLRFAPIPRKSYPRVVHRENTRKSASTLQDKNAVKR
jgi:hypothetical protein